MGVLIILTGLLISVLMWGNLKNIYVIFALYMQFIWSHQGL